MFSMFFGAGNIVFPLALGDQAGEHYLYAMAGLLITAVGVPFLGLVAMTLYHGDYRAFFGQLGRWPGFIVTAIILGLLGPFGVIPRCLVVSFSTLKLILPDLTALPFYLATCLLILVLSLSKKSMVNILGYILTPAMIGLLAWVIVAGIWQAPEVPTSNLSPQPQFWLGLKEGYQTMDLLAAFFFSSLIISTIRQQLTEEQRQGSHWPVVKEALKASIIGASLLALVYIGFCYIAAAHHGVIDATKKEEILGKIAFYVLGPSAGVVVAGAIILACLTTAIALAGVFAQFLSEDCTQGRISYFHGLLITLLITFGFSFLDFQGIAAFLNPLLEILYPGLIMLSLVSLAKKLSLRPSLPIQEVALSE